jgi:hypothetical protein
VTTSRERTDPYELVFGGESLDDRLFPPIAEEAEARDHPLGDPERFVFLTSVGRLLQAIAGEPEGGGAPGAGAGEAFRQHGLLLFHAFHFWRAGRSRAELDEAGLRRVLDPERVEGESAPAPPGVAGYLRLPRNLVWAAPAPGERPEPADGFFWTYDPAEAEPATLRVLMPLGVRSDRPGFSVVTATGIVEGDRDWANEDARPGSTDFATTLPGGELERLYSIETTAELLKLASRCFRALRSAGG